MAKSNKLLQYLLLSTSLIFILLIVLAFRPITSLHIEDCIKVSGITTKVWANEKSKDINIRIGDGGHYYINRGLEHGVSESIFTNKIMGKEIIIHYADHWTPLDPSGTVRHVARVSYGEEILYDEILE